MAAPRPRSASTRSPIGRSCMRATPDRRYSPPHSASAAVSGRKAVPALPRNSSAALTGNAPPAPHTSVAPPSSRTAMPSARKASSMYGVGIERVVQTLPPGQRGEQRYAIEMLFDPGSLTVPETLRIGARSRNSTASAIVRKAASLLLLQPFVACSARALCSTRLHRPWQACLRLGSSRWWPPIAQRLAVGDADVAPISSWACG